MNGGKFNEAMEKALSKEATLTDREVVIDVIVLE